MRFEISPAGDDVVQHVVEVELTASNDDLDGTQWLFEVDATAVEPLSNLYQVKILDGDRAGQQAEAAAAISPDDASKAWLNGRTPFRRID